MKLTCFKAYDIRGELGHELNEDIAYRIGRAYGEYLKPNTVVVGCDIRESSPMLKEAVIRGLLDTGSNVIDIGTTGTEEVYFATFHFEADGGIEITASHNPINYNGMKLVRENAKPISGDTGLKEIQKLAEKNEFTPAPKKGTIHRKKILESYIQHLFTYISPSKLRPLKLVVNAGNGAAGHVIDAIEAKFSSLSVPVEFIKIHHQPDHTFPNGIPNPLIPENRHFTSNAVIQHNANMGIAWDGDFDRCFLFDEKGKFIEGYYIVGLLAAAFLEKHPGEKIIHDPRLTWNTIDIVNQYGGTPIQSKTGHAFIKERMRQENAIYGGEMSAHHYFRDFAYCDSGMIPWLLTIQLMSNSEKPLSTLVGDREAMFPCSGELNYRVQNSTDTLNLIKEHFTGLNPAIDRTDGISLEFDDWRMNVRSSNTEPLLRLNVETRGSLCDIASKVAKIEKLIYLSTS
ncbi:phosphomannomutase CpsG [Oxalobacter vibrioformis]|uniref:Phosphomannomutase CpsG n=2 Tax=Oxalobacter vibrioformis TaxID=933080 RepID=A0A9E9M1A4_9BURK|nr:phosphomannomutase CpsG [Oxalobacter vibrioformis]